MPRLTWLPSRALRASLLATVAALLIGSALTSSSALAKQPPKPTVVLVHGAFADASGWSDVIDRLERRGYPVIAPPNPLRGGTADAAYMRALPATTPGPVVLFGPPHRGQGNPHTPPRKP